MLSEMPSCKFSDAGTIERIRPLPCWHNLYTSLRNDFGAIMLRNAYADDSTCASLAVTIVSLGCE